MDKKLFEQAKGAKSAEELMSLAKTAGIDMGEENAKQLFAQLNRSGELSDDELNNVAGGGCKSDHRPSEYVGRQFTPNKNIKCKYCGSKIFVATDELLNVRSTGTEVLVRGECAQCGRITLCFGVNEVKFI